VVDIDRSPAGFAGPALPLGFHERTDAIFPDGFKVVEHAHAIFPAVPRVQLFQPTAREFAAVGMAPVLHLFAGSDGAVDIAQPFRCITSLALVLLSEVGHADGAIHAAGSYEDGPERGFPCHTGRCVSGLLIHRGLCRPVPGIFFLIRPPYIPFSDFLYLSDEK
jgi:hypothetical protein